MLSLCCLPQSCEKRELLRWMRRLLKPWSHRFLACRGGWAQGSVAGVFVLLLAGCGGGDPLASDAGSANSDSSGPVVLLSQGGFTINYDCSLHSALRYDYTLGADTGNLTRPDNYMFDPSLPSGCGQQTSTSSYASVMPGWDRGHLVASNHMDNDANYLLRANYMSNIVPQAAALNRGIWLATENLAECYRDLAPVRVLGGVVYSSPANDYFLLSHGIRTPDFFWKLILTTEPGNANLKVIAWYIPNSNEVAGLDSYLISIAELERKLGVATVGIDAPVAVKAAQPSVSWSLPAGCSLG